jgi:hypothetical protein
MRERDIERYLRVRVEALGGRALKWVSPGVIGVPDRILLLPGGRIAFCEVKAPGEKPNRIQAWWLGVLERLGFTAGWVDSFSAVDEFLAEMA